MTQSTVENKQTQPATQEKAAMFGLRYVEKQKVKISDDPRTMRMSQWMDPRDTGWIDVA